MAAWLCMPPTQPGRAIEVAKRFSRSPPGLRRHTDGRGRGNEFEHTCSRRNCFQSALQHRRACGRIERYRRRHSPILHSRPGPAHCASPPVEPQFHRTGDRSGPAIAAGGVGQSCLSAIGRRYPRVLGCATVSRDPGDHQKRHRQRKPGRRGGLWVGLHVALGRRGCIRCRLHRHRTRFPARRPGDKAACRPGGLDPHEPPAPGAAAAGLDPVGPCLPAQVQLRQEFRGRWRQAALAPCAGRNTPPRSAR